MGGRGPVQFVSAILLVFCLFAATCSGSPDVERSVPCGPSSNEPTSMRYWSEQILNAIRRDIPDPTEHARNLYQLSVLWWDLWSSHQGSGNAVVHRERLGMDDSEFDQLVSYASSQFITERYGDSRATRISVDRALSIRAPEVAVGLQEVGDRFLGALRGVADSDGSKNLPTHTQAGVVLDIDEPFIAPADPDRWQPLQIQGRTTQTGVPEPDLQAFLGYRWGDVTGFAVESYRPGSVHDPGPPPKVGDTKLWPEVAEVLVMSESLGAENPVRINVGPATRGNNALGQDDGTGYDQNPSTGEPYEPKSVREADFGRAIAEYWADGPGSETPPGHWNVILNATSDALFGGRCGLGALGVDALETTTRTEWDAKTYLMLNGALHDAAIVAWGVKTQYESARPITLVRLLSAPGGMTAYADPSLAGARVQVASAASLANGGVHAETSAHEGDVLVLAHGPAGTTTWLGAGDWLPYQLPSFVSPSFPGYVSGHSVFSRAAAEVLADISGTTYFPGGMASVVVNELEFDTTRFAPVELQWATFFDASDQAGLSRRYGGIHIAADDVRGRELGSLVGRDALAYAHTLFSDS